MARLAVEVRVPRHKPGDCACLTVAASAECRRLGQRESLHHEFSDARTVAPYHYVSRQWSVALRRCERPLTVLWRATDGPRVPDALEQRSTRRGRQPRSLEHHHEHLAFG